MEELKTLNKKLEEQSAASLKKVTEEEKVWHEKLLQSAADIEELKKEIENFQKFHAESEDEKIKRMMELEASENKLRGELAKMKEDQDNREKKLEDEKSQLKNEKSQLQKEIEELNKELKNKRFFCC